MFAFFLSADWSKEPSKRSVYVADLEERRIRKAHPGACGWNLDSLLVRARELSRHGKVLIGVDLALGVSRGYWRLLLGEHRRPATFVDWMRELDSSGEFFHTATEPEKWRAHRPWFAVPSGEGGLRSFTEKAGDRFLRRIDTATNAKPLFAVSGIPGTVGSGTREFWKELIPRLARKRDFAIWPFEEDLSCPRSGHRIVLAETYPGLAYAAALAGHLPARPMRIAKTKRAARDCASECLAQAAWVSDGLVDVGKLGSVRASDDDFDAHLTAAAVLRCVIEGIPLARPEWIDAEVEGSMLLAGPVDPDGKAGRQFSGWRGSPSLSASSLPSPNFHFCRPAVDASEGYEYCCPIPGCSKVFLGSRSGWDSHVRSLRMHPDWHPEVTDPAARKRLFKSDFHDWFS